MNFKRIATIARWEFLTRVRSRAFLLSLLVMPVLLLGVSLAPLIFGKNIDLQKEFFKTSGETDFKQYALYDETNSFAYQLQEVIRQRHTLPNGNPAYIFVPETGFKNADSFKKFYVPKVESGEFDGFLILLKNVADTRKIEFSSQDNDQLDIERVSNSVEYLLFKQVFQDQLSQEDLEKIGTPVTATSPKIPALKKSAKRSQVAIFLLFGVIIIQFLVITNSAQMLVRGLFEEKSSRIIELILSSAKTSELMYGKLLGLGALGILQGIVWSLTGILLVSSFGLHIGFTAQVPLMALFSILGYFFYASIMIGLGSLASTEQEAQFITSYTVLFTLFPASFTTYFLENPDTNFAAILSVIPFFSPPIMIARLAAGHPTFFEIVSAILGLILGIILALQLSSRLFKNVLSDEKRPFFQEVFGAFKST
ncbi:MAG: ABC transporter permease [Bacteroidota bacterium]